MGGRAVIHGEGSGERRTDEAGFSLIELIFSLVLLGLVLGAAVPAMFSALDLARNNRNRSIAAALASQQIDLARDTAASNFASLGTGAAASVQVVDKVTYSIEQDGEWVAPGATTSSCSGSTAASPSFLRITVFVSWPNMGGIPRVQNQTILAPPSGSYDPYKGAIAVTVRDRNGKPPSPGVVVQVNSSPLAQSQTTSSDGCAYFAGLTPNTIAFPLYTVTLNNAGYVDGLGNAPSTTTVAVQPGKAPQVSVDYDLAASLQVTLGSASVPAGVVPSGVPLTLYNSVGGTRAVPGSGSPRSVPNLFPYSGGYKVWAGDCADADPEGLKPPPPTPGNPYYPTGVRPNAVAVTPGGTTAVGLTLRSVDVKVTRLLGTLAVPGATITAIHAADPNSCTLGDSLILAGVTDATGTMRIALPYGTWTFKATTAVPVATGTGGSVALAPTTVGVPAVAVGILP